MESESERNVQELVAPRDDVMAVERRWLRCITRPPARAGVGHLIKRQLKLRSWGCDFVDCKMTTLLTSYKG
ncbi:hypothetical protein E2C01_035701 [Portunus trituberculatus]|uniref:Uncharacterized protein n=1 Tax=Portunus trituberculatus TaxID=210409 RepID=A0A5B7F953_PORTR|nr:hypothetical protein [Portunus trituberculatus]